ncbi:MAG: hypothetical protein HY248_05045 [Fimbriimonas ginsengisoli]|uniref:Uncharacterized protein n=1 Tax=Fimbriimonas ginsengisoli TaxID=1005039 RepID=A0A931PUJ3_FIMGI|nr:hypothetical protein [Fimbriimonas ginsengisoli]MBI3721902.1 hypothetical protein [Fimbriimonas ginsengisoli]
MRGWTVAFGLGVAAFAGAQAPDVLLHVDARLNYRSFNDGGTGLRWYDTLGRPSTAGVLLKVEPGLRMVVSQRFERIPGDGDPDQLDEYYVEETGNWRFGKQYLPIGLVNLVRESVVAVRSDASLRFAHLPMSFLVCDGGSGRPRGIVAQIRSVVGLSVAAGDHFGVSAATLALVRRPEDSSGIGHGYREVFAADYEVSGGPAVVKAEFVSLHQPNEPPEVEGNFFDVSVTLRSEDRRTLGAGVTRALDADTTVLRAFANWPVATNLSLEPLLREKDGKAYDFAVSLRLKF